MPLYFKLGQTQRVRSCSSGCQPRAFPQTITSPGPSQAAQRGLWLVQWQGTQLQSHRLRPSDPIPHPSGGQSGSRQDTSQEHAVEELPVRRWKQWLGEKYKPAIHLAAFISNRQINTSHFKTNPSLCRQARRVSQKLSQCSMKSPQKEHKMGSEKYRPPPPIALFLDKAASKLKMHWP